MTGQPVRLPRWTAQSSVVGAGTAGVLIGAAVALLVSIGGLEAALAAAIIAVASLLVRRLVVREQDRALRMALTWGFAATVLGALAYYVLFFQQADAFGYAARGTSIADAARDGRLDLSQVRHIPGTGVVDVASGVVMLLVGPSVLGGFFIFATAAYLGKYLMVQAVRQVLPLTSTRAFALFVFFWPSLVFWPSTIGKEALITMALGAVLLGLVRLLTFQGAALVPLLGGLLGAALVRPHMGALLSVSLVIAITVRRVSLRRLQSAARRGRLRRIARAVLVAGSIALSAEFTRRFFRLGAVSDVSGALDRVARLTSRGGSEFEVEGARTLSQIPQAALSALLRPFPWESHRLEALASAVESALLLITLLLLAPFLLKAVRWMLPPPLTAFVLTYVACFLVLFSNIANWGILVRQRVQILPLVLLLLACALTQARHPTRT